MNRVCICCANRFPAEGKENVCPTCDGAEFFNRTCAECNREFRSEEPFAAHCQFCADSIYETSRPLYET